MHLKRWWQLLWHTLKAQDSGELLGRRTLSPSLNFGEHAYAHQSDPLESTHILLSVLRSSWARSPNRSHHRRIRCLHLRIESSPGDSHARTLQWGSVERLIPCMIWVTQDYKDNNYVHFDRANIVFGSFAGLISGCSPSSFPHEYFT